ncbi:hypothetical protein BDL97_19G083100 [Sphagnum fallax]|nr:hypothetical protein BDL97_19G083100 [Sphagnum fallax]
MEMDSWEVRAFAEDVSGSSGMQWPPSSYFCSFCHREFRTAQALGGHMNVHRRERAAAHKSNAAHQLRDPSFFSSTSLTSSLYQAVVTVPEQRESENLQQQQHRPAGPSSNQPLHFNYFSHGSSSAVENDLHHHENMQHLIQSRNFLHPPAAALKRLQDSSIVEMDNNSSSIFQPHSYRSSTSCLRQELSGSPTALKGPAAARLQLHADSAHEAEAATASCRSTVAQSEHHHQDHQISSLDLELRLGHMQSSP